MLWTNLFLIFYNFLNNIMLHTIFFLIVYLQVSIFGVSIHKNIFLLQSRMTWQWCLGAKMIWSVRTGWMNQFQLQAVLHFKCWLLCTFYVCPHSVYKCACTVVYIVLPHLSLSCRSRGSAHVRWLDTYGCVTV